MFSYYQICTPFLNLLPDKIHKTKNSAFLGPICSCMRTGVKGRSCVHTMYCYEITGPDEKILWFKPITEHQVHKNNLLLPIEYWILEFFWNRFQPICQSAQNEMGIFKTHNLMLSQPVFNNMTSMSIVINPVLVIFVAIFEMFEIKLSTKPPH